MKVLGDNFRETRKKQRLSQSSLAAGICTQATISKIENKNSCESLTIFHALCAKLGVSVNDYLADNEEQKLEQVLDEAEQLCYSFDHKGAYELLDEYGTVDVSHLTDYLATKYLYYKGRTSSNGMGYYEEGLSYLTQAQAICSKPNIYTILSVNATAVTYILNGEGMGVAQKYFEKSYQMLQELPEDVQSSLSCIVYYSLAKYYSELKEYQKSIDMCNAGIELNKKNQTNHYLESLLYEKAYNEYYLNGSKEGYKMAYYFTRYINNEHIMEHVIENMKKYNITL